LSTAAAAGISAAMPNTPARIILRLTCPDRPGILAAVSPALSADGWDIRSAHVHGDPDTRIFFVRMELAGVRGAVERLPAILDPFRQSLGLDWDLRDAARRMKLLVAVSRTDHCLNDIIHKTRIGVLPVEIVGVVSNHETLRAVSEWHGHPFHHLPVEPQGRAAQEAALAALIADTGAELVVLARYMQVLSDGFAASLAGRCINIHHSFLPSFKGARPYHQAHARGVKLIGATAHYVTAELDEGPIIEQDIRRVTHNATADDMVEIGRETEASVLSRAIRWHAEGRVFLNGNRTVVFA
jgi:formyltetrahydrofolate deformylase